MEDEQFTEYVEKFYDMLNSENPVLVLEFKTDRLGRMTVNVLCAKVDNTDDAKYLLQGIANLSWEDVTIKNV